jgi:hypothetical protein
MEKNDMNMHKHLYTLLGVVVSACNPAQAVMDASHRPAWRRAHAAMQFVAGDIFATASALNSIGRHNSDKPGPLMKEELAARKIIQYANSGALDPRIANVIMKIAGDDSIEAYQDRISKRTSHALANLFSCPEDYPENLGKRPDGHIPVLEPIVWDLLGQRSRTLSPPITEDGETIYDTTSAPYISLSPVSIPKRVDIGALQKSVCAHSISLCNDFMT